MHKAIWGVNPASHVITSSLRRNKVIFFPLGLQAFSTFVSISATLTYYAHVYFLYKTPAIYFSLTLSGGNHASCRVVHVTKTVGLETIIFAYTPWINRWRAEIQWPDQGRCEKCKVLVLSVEKCIPEDNRWALIWILIHQCAFTLSRGAVVAMPMPSRFD